MPNLRDIRKRIRSVKSTQLITRAMKMVAAAKLRRAQENALSQRPYAEGLGTVLAHVAQRASASRHPLLQERTEGYRVLVVVASDRGFCGGFNSTLNRTAVRMLDQAAKEGDDLRLYIVGRKARDFFKWRNYEQVAQKLNIFASLTFGNAEIMGNELVKLYLDGTVREVTIMYNHFKSTMTQVITPLRLLPIAVSASSEEAARRGELDYKYEPDADSILEKLLPLHVNSQIYHALIESMASENAARMMAMDNATKNAGDMIDSLTLTMNKIRQASITRELIEVVSGASALKE